jgi:hypothetical protein
MHTTLKSLLLLLGFLLLAGPGGGMATAHAEEQHIILLIDRSGAMNVLESDGQTRFQKAIGRAQQRVLAPSTATRHFAVWSFEGSSYIEHLAFTPNIDFVMSSLFHLRAGFGQTPLALALCAAVDHLTQYRPSVLATKDIALFIGTRENSTPLGAQCAGPWSPAQYPFFSPQSWQWKVLNKLRTGNPQNPNSVPFPLIANYDSVFLALANAGPVIP